jgi:hypothetical protein
MRALVIVMLLAGIAHADEATDRASAEKYFRAGERAYAAQNFAAAAAQWEEAYKLYPLPGIAFSLGSAYRRQYRVDPKLEYAKRSAELYRVYLDKVKTGGKVGMAADYLGEMDREVDKLTRAGAKIVAEVVVERTRLGVSPILGTEKKGAMGEIVDLPDPAAVKIKVTIDGKDVPPFELVEVEPGQHKVHVEAEGYMPSDTVASVVKGASPTVDPVMTPRPGKVTLETEKGVRVRVDGRPVGTAPLTAFEVPAGKHLLTLSAVGREPVAREIEIERGGELTLKEPLQKTARRRAVPFVVTGAVALGVITIGGAAFAIKLDNDADDKLAAIRAGDQRPGAKQDYDDLVRRRGEVFTGTLITGGACLVVAGIAGAMYWLDRPSEEGLRVTPMVTPGGGGMAYSRRF